MTQREELIRFIEAARQNGIADQAIVSLLESSGWSVKEVLGAMRDHYEKVAGVPVPLRRGVGEGARDAFLHLLAFGTLATWTIALGALLFAWVERTWPDPVMSAQYYADNWQAGNLASLIVAFPIYLLATRQTLRENRDTGVRRWLTWLALLIAASIVIGDLIAVLAWLLRGEATIRFLLKATIVFVLAGGVFWFYISWIREAGVNARAFAAAAAIAVGVGLLGGFLIIGSPSEQRKLEADRRRIQHMREIAGYLGGRSELPDIAPAHIVDPVTNQPYEYRKLGATRYELCATFDSPGAERSMWAHGPGRHCFSLDASASRLPY